MLLEDNRSNLAVAATAGKIRLSGNGTIVSTEFSASNGPRTAGGSFPVRDDAGDGTAQNPNHRWVRVLDADTLAATYGLGSITSALMVDAADPQYRIYDGIWFNDLVLTGSNGNTFRQQAWDFRGANGLPSPGFTVRVVTRNTSNASMAFIGDSIGVGVAGSDTTPLRILTDGTFASSSFDSAVSRRTNVATAVSSGVQVAAALPMNLDLVVVELGYNDAPSGFADDIDAMMTTLTARGVRRVVWVNLAEDRTSIDGSSYYRQSNAALNAARARWPNLDVALWNQASAVPEHVRWFAGDGVHLTTTGNAQFSLWLRDYLAGGSKTSARRFFANQRVELQVVGETVTGANGAVGAVPAGASAVALNITGVEPDEAGYMTVWPCEVAPSRGLEPQLHPGRGGRQRGDRAGRRERQGLHLLEPGEPPPRRHRRLVRRRRPEHRGVRRHHAEPLHRHPQRDRRPEGPDPGERDPAACRWPAPRCCAPTARRRTSPPARPPSPSTSPPSTRPPRAI